LSTITPAPLEPVSHLVELECSEEPESPAALLLSAVGKRWGGVPVLEGLQLVLEPGTVAWVGGRNGAGKTTMLRIAAGLIDPDAGSAARGASASATSAWSPSCRPVTAACTRG
jgi:ABC-type sugar transport system ATPase subunit